MWNIYMVDWIVSGMEDKGLGDEVAIPSCVRERKREIGQHLSFVYFILLHMFVLRISGNIFKINIQSFLEQYL
jgi:hypothetical protein